MLLLVAIVLLVTVGSHMINWFTHSTANTIAAAVQAPTPSTSATMPPAKLRSLDDWSIRAGLYEAHDEPSTLPYEPDSDLGTQSAACRTQKATLAPLRHALLAAPDKTLATDAGRYDHAVRDLLHACIHDHPVALHHARTRMDAAASAVNVRYNRLLGVDPSSYTAKRVL